MSRSVLDDGRVEAFDNMVAALSPQDVFIDGWVLCKFSAMLLSSVEVLVKSML
jgi:hypothetical protein